MNNKFYITTTLPYINSEPHIGFAAEIIKADVIARYYSQKGFDVIFNTGTDEHGQKIFQKANEAGLDVQEFCDRNYKLFPPLKEKLNLSYSNFIRTTDKRHKEAAQKFWQICFDNGDIYKKQYQVKYCVGCEMEKTDSELEKGRCPLHPNVDLELINEENYFFRFSKYQDSLLKLYKDNPYFVLPPIRHKEIESFVKRGLNDFSISRLKEKMPHGVSVPGDESQVMYVWFDALVNYISTLGWPDEKGDFATFWPGIQVCGKDNLRPQSAMWQAMLMSAGIANSKQVHVFGFLTANGKKISKSAGNGVDPIEIVDIYGSDALRHFLLAEIPTFADGDYSPAKFHDRYTADLANGLGNLCSRVSNLLEKNEIATNLSINLDFEDTKQLGQAYDNLATSYNFNDFLFLLWQKIRECDETLSIKTPWKMSDKKEIEEVLKPISQVILNMSYFLQPFLPSSATIIEEAFSKPQVSKITPLFPRVDRKLLDKEYKD